MFLRRKHFKHSEKKSEFFAFDSQELYSLRQNRLTARIKRLFFFYPWWFYYLCYILLFSLFIIGVLLYAFYAPASINLSINERFFIKLPVTQYIYPDSLQNLSNTSRKAFWENYIQYETDSLDPSFISLEEEGPLPIPYQGIPLWKRFRSSYQEPLDPTKKKLVIIISNLGNHKDSTELLIDTPAEVTLEFNPYSDFLSQWMLFSRAQGHETLLTVPLSHARHLINYDPGPLGINFDFTPEDNLKLMRKIMAVTTGYIGLSFFHWPENASAEQFGEIFSLVKDHGLAVIGQENYQNVFRNITGLPAATLDWQLFNYNINDNHLRQLDDFVDNLPDSGEKIHIIRIDNTPFSNEDLFLWIDETEFQIVPFSYLFDPVR